MGYLTTHVLDTANGCPAAGVRVELYRLDTSRALLIQSETNQDGRLNQPLLEKEKFITGHYELIFYAGDYFAQRNTDIADPPFVDEVVLRFGIADSEQHYHVPLLVSPWSYSTYRGS